MSVVELLNEVVESTGPHALWILFGASMMEYLFPPFPGDTVTLLGAYYAVVGALPIFWVFAAVTTGSVLGSAFNYWIGRKLRAFSAKREGLPFPFAWLEIQKLKKIEENWVRRGDWLILLNRFIPAIRGLFFVAAGMGQISFKRVMLLGALSAALWNTALLAVGYLVGARLEELESLFETYTAFAWAMLSLLFLIIVVRALWLRRKALRSRDRDQAA